jgi:hypothetical protein
VSAREVVRTDWRIDDERRTSLESFDEKDHKIRIPARNRGHEGILERPERPNEMSPP